MDRTEDRAVVRYEARDLPGSAATASQPARVGLITLDRPAVHNVVDDRVMADLEAILDRVEADPAVAALVLTGSGSRTFCAGGDLDWFATLPSREQGLAMSRRMQAILARLADGERPVVAAINGDAWGGGCEIVAACHLRIVAEGARFAFRQAAMGVVTGWGGGARLFRLVGRSQAMRLLLTAETIDAAEAVRIGLVDRAVPAERVLPAALELAAAVAGNARPAVAGFLELARAADREGAGERLRELETELFGRLWEAAPFQRRLADWRVGRAKRGSD